MRCARALSTLQLMPAAGSRKTPVATPCWVDLPKRLSGRVPSAARTGHPIAHHVAGLLSVDPDKAGRRHARRRLPPPRSPEADMT
jgi:hypothetical protein